MKTKIIWIIVISLILLGSLKGSSGGLWPFYTIKTSDTYGINFCLFTEYAPGVNHYGLNLSLITVLENKSKVNGINLNVFSGQEELSGVNGLSVGLMNSLKGSISRGVSLSIIDSPFELSVIKNEFHGLQIGIIYSCAKEGNVVQIGVIDQIKLKSGKIRTSIGVNGHFE